MNIKMSDFNLSRKMVLENGVVTYVNPRANGEIEFYNIDKKRLEKINKEVIQNLDDNEDLREEEFTYRIWNYICNIEKNVDLDIFKEMCDFPPCEEWALVLEQVANSVNSLVNMTGTAKRIEDKTNSVLENNPQLKELIEIDKLKRSEIQDRKEIEKKKIQEIENLYKELNEIKGFDIESKKLRNEILDKLKELSE